MTTTAPYSIRELPASYDPGFLKTEHQSIQRAITGVASATDMGFSVVKSAGATADSTNNILNAVAAGIPFFPPGTYNYSQTLIVDKPWFGVSGLSILKPSSVVSVAVDLRTGGHGDGLDIDGSNTTGKIGLGVGVPGLVNILSWSNGRIHAFLGAGGRGIKVIDLVTGWFENLYVDGNYINLHTNGTMGTPTDTKFVTCQFRSATTKGVWIQNGYGIRFYEPLCEANGEEGFYLQNTGDNAVEIALYEYWCEANWQSVASGALRHTNYDIFCDGANGPSGTIRLVLRDGKHAEGVTAARAIHLTNCLGYVIDNCKTTNEAGQILIDGTSYGHFPSWQNANGAFLTTVSANFADPIAAWNSQSQLVDNIEAAWTDYTPTASAGTMTLTGLTFSKARYKQVGKTVTVAITTSLFTTGGTATATIDITLPTNIQSLDANQWAVAWINDGTYTDGGVRCNGSAPTSSIKVARQDAAVWGLGANRQIRFTFEFEGA